MITCLAIIIPDQTALTWNLAELPGGHHSTPLVVGNNDHIQCTPSHTQYLHKYIDQVYATHMREHFLLVFYCNLELYQQ